MKKDIKRSSTRGFSSNLFYGLKYISTIWVNQLTKNAALESFSEQKPLKYGHFWQREAPEAQTWGCLNITLAQKWHPGIFQISAEKSFSAWQKSSCTFLYSFGGCNLQNHAAKPLDSFNKCRKIILSCWETFFCRNLKNARMSFLGQCNVETASCPGL